MHVEFVRKHVIPKRGKFEPGQVENIPTNTAVHLITAGVCRQIVPTDARKMWSDLRQSLGVRPYDPHVIFGDTKLIRDARAGDKIMIIRKYGGLGDILISSYLLNEIHRRYPNNPLYYAVPHGYHEMFRNVKWLNLVDYARVYESYHQVRGGVIKAEIVKDYEVVEDISTPCHVWESLFGVFNYDQHLKWQNRIEIWGHWIGINDITNPKSCIRISKREIEAARKKHFKQNGKPICLVSPISALTTKDYPYHYELVKALSNRYKVLYFGEPKKLPGAIKADTFREFLAIIGAADLVISVDTAQLHGGAIMRTKTYGLFNINDGQTYCKWYPTVTPIQLCDTPCIMKKAWECDANGKRVGKICYKPESIKVICDRLRKDGML